MSNELEELWKTKVELLEYIKGFLNNRQHNNVENDNRTYMKSMSETGKWRDSVPHPACSVDAVLLLDIKTCWVNTHFLSVMCLPAI